MLTQIIRTYQDDGVSGIIGKLLMRLRYLYHRALIDDSANSAKWEAVHGKFKDKRVFLVGNGPSLNKTPLYLLKNEYTMCFNRFYIMTERLNWKPYFYMTVDDLVLSDLVNESDLVVPKTKYSFFPDVHFRGINFKRKMKRYENVLWTHNLISRGFSHNLPKIHSGGTVVGQAIQVLSFLGFSEIYLVGVDMNFRIHTSAERIDRTQKTNIISRNDDDPNHFDPRYFGKNKQYHQPEARVIDDAHEILKWIASYAKTIDLKILNAGYDSHLGGFNRTEFVTLFKYSGSEVKSLFEECLFKHSSLSSVEEFEKKYQYLDSFEIADAELDSFHTNESKGLQVLKRLIFSHIPIGPYQGKYYFLKRADHEA